MTKLDYRTVWISDIHLGSKGCKAEDLLEFLNSIQCETLYLVGDILDLWKFKSGFFWPRSHNAIVRKFIDLANSGTRVIYIPGNHDDLFRQYADINFNGIEIMLQAMHITRDGRKFLIMHGDEFDNIVRQHERLASIGATAYDILIVVNRWYNQIRKHLGYSYWSLSAYLKHKVKNAVNFINNFQHILSLEAQKQHVDGIICGHIHHADISAMENDKTYCNTGDWVESCTALTEDKNGNLQIIRWLEDRQVLLNTSEIKCSTIAEAA